MAEPIQANYKPDGDDWTITVSGRGKQLTARAPGIIAARDRTDQLAEQLAPDEEHRTVVHLLNGDALQFTSAYLTARLAKPEPAKPPTATPEPAPAPTPVPAKPAESATEQKSAKRTPSPRPRTEPAPAVEPTTTAT